MQKLLNKLSFFFIFTFSITLQLLTNQSFAGELEDADILFEQREYSKALEKYQELLATGSYSSQMLMKMAYIQEGFGKVPQALFYLSLLNKLAPNDGTLQKMADLAQSRLLEGYSISDEAYFIYLLRKNKVAVLTTLGAIGLLGLALLFWLQQRKYDLIGPAIVLGLYGLFVVWAANVETNPQQGVIMSNSTFLMEAPSAGAGLRSTLNAGHRLTIVGQSDIWYEVVWQGEKGFVRNSNLKIIQ